MMIRPNPYRRSADIPSPSFQIEHSGSSDTGIGDCCGRNSRRVWGFVRSVQGIISYPKVVVILGALLFPLNPSNHTCNQVILI